MRERPIVVDLNFIEGPNADRDIGHLRTAGADIILPETALFELWKQPDAEKREHSMKRAFRRIRKVPNQLFLARSAGTLARLEVESGCPGADLIDVEATTWLRRFMDEVYKGRGAALAQFRRNIDPLSHEIQAHHDGHTDKAMSLGGVDAWTTVFKENADSSLVKRLRKGDDEVVVKALREGLARYGWSFSIHYGIAVQHPRDVVQARCAFALHSIVTFADQLLWAADGGAKTRPGSKFTNDRADRSYVLIALLGRWRLGTNDKRPKRIFNLCRQAMDTYQDQDGWLTRDAALDLVARAQARREQST